MRDFLWAAMFALAFFGVMVGFGLALGGAIIR